MLSIQKELHFESPGFLWCNWMEFLDQQCQWLSLGTGTTLEHLLSAPNYSSLSRFAILAGNVSICHPPGKYNTIHPTHRADSSTIREPTQPWTNKSWFLFTINTHMASWDRLTQVLRLRGICRSWSKLLLKWYQHPRFLSRFCRDKEKGRLDQFDPTSRWGLVYWFQ